MVVAKTDRAHQALAAQFADHGRTGPLERGYLAFVWGVPPRPSGTIDAPIARAPGSRDKMAVRAGGRRAITHWRVLERYNGANGKPVASLIACRLETGRTHQIRVHFAALHHPCAGDLTYGADPVLAKRLGLERQWLHARSLAFSHPADGRRVEITSPYPADLQHALDVLRNDEL
jgi:23S rRNA pseudouridine1911/1915/1917 synthase